MSQIINSVGIFFVLYFIVLALSGTTRRLVELKFFETFHVSREGAIKYGIAKYPNLISSWKL